MDNRLILGIIVLLLLIALGVFTWRSYVRYQKKKRILEATEKLFGIDEASGLKR